MYSLRINSALEEIVFLKKVKVKHNLRGKFFELYGPFYFNIGKKVFGSTHAKYDTINFKEFLKK